MCDEFGLVIFIGLNLVPPKPVATPSNAWVCGPSLAGIAGSSPDGGMDVCLLGIFCDYKQ
jgi:hypothetical protein